MSLAAISIILSEIHFLSRHILISVRLLCGIPVGNMWQKTKICNFFIAKLN